MKPVAYRFKSPATEGWLLGLEPPVGSRWEIEGLYRMQVNVPRTPLEKAAKEMLQCVDRMLRDGEWYAAQERADNLRAALEQAEPVECPLEIHPIHAKYCSAQVCDFCKAQQTGPVVEPVAWHFQSFEDWWDSHGFHNAFEAGQIDGKPLAKLVWEVAREIAPQPKQAEPVQAETVVEPVVDPSVESMLQAGRFCDANCTAMDHHADCVIGNPSF